jgi:hypothetical protein
MSKKHPALSAPASVTTGTAIDVSDLTGVTVALYGTFTGTYKVMASYDGSTFKQVGSSLTAAGKQAVDDAAVAVRIDCSAYTSGTPTATVSGLKASKRVKAHSVPAGVGTGTLVVDVSEMTGVSVEFFGIGTGTYKVMASYGAGFVQMGSSVTADGKVAVDDAAMQLRIDCSAFTSGTPAAVVEGAPQATSGKQPKKKLSVVAPASVTTGTAVDVSDMTSAVVAVNAIGVGTYAVMVSHDGASFVQHGSSLTADGKVAIDDAVIKVRVDCTAYTSGTPAATVSGVQS